MNQLDQNGTSNLLEASWQLYKLSVWHLPETIYSFLCLANLILATASLLAFGSFLIGWRGPVFNWLLMIAGTLCALSIPHSWYLSNYHWRPWIFPFLAVGLVYLPWVLAFLIETRFGPQRRLRRLLQQGLILLFLLNLIWSYLP